MNALAPIARAPESEPIKPVGAVTAALQVLRCLGRHAEPRRLSEIVREIGLNPSTTLNILRTLEHEGLVTLDRDAKRYGLGQGLADLAAPLLRDDAQHRFARALDAAAKELGATVALWRLVGDDVELVQVAESAAVMRIAFSVGRRLPRFLGAMGRVVAARLDVSAEALEAGFARVAWASPPDYAQWLADLETTRETGVGVDRGHVNRGVLGVAVPVELEGPPLHIIAAAMFETDQGPGIPTIARRLQAVAAHAAEAIRS